MITKKQIDGLHKILALGSWESPAELIFAAFTKNSNVEAPPPHKFITLSVLEYDIVMSYGVSELAKTRFVPNEIKYSDEAIEFDPSNFFEEPPDNIMPERKYGFVTAAKTKAVIKKMRSVEGDYISIWNRPLLGIEDSLAEEDENPMQPPKKQLPQNPSKALFNTTIEEDALLPVTATFNPGITEPRELTMEESAKLLKKFIDGHKTQSDTEKNLIVKKTSEALAEFANKSGNDIDLDIQME